MIRKIIANMLFLLTITQQTKTLCWGSTNQRFQVELTKTVTDGSPRTEKDTKYVST